MHILGLQGMTRRIYTYQVEMGWGGLNLFVSLSALILASGFALFFFDAIRSARHGPVAAENPWGAPTLEWATTSPPPSYNFARIPVVASGYPLWDQPEAPMVATGLRVDRRELVITSVADARPEARESSPANSIWPLWTALATTLMLISSIFTPWAVVWGAVPIAAALIGWFWPKGTPEDEA
jgi:cytochrome c oxidase subunit 1